MTGQKSPAFLTIDEYHFMWGLLALQDQNAEKLTKMTHPDQQAVAKLYPNGYTHVEALRLGLKYQRLAEENEHPPSSAKKTQNPIPDMDEFSEGRLKGVSDPRLSDEDLELSGALETDDAIPRLYRRVTSSLAQSKTLRQDYAKKLDTFAEIIEENGLRITAHSEDLDRRLLYAPVEKNLSAAIIATGIAHQQYVKNALEMKARQKSALQRFTPVKPDIQSN